MNGRSKTVGAASSQLLRQLPGWSRLAALAGGRKASSFTGLGFALPELQPGDSARAMEFYRGHFTFSGETLACQPSEIFVLAPPSPGWARELHGFGWLADLRASGLALHRAFARNLVLRWAQKGKRTELDVACLRLVNCSVHAGYLMRGASSAFEQEFLRFVSAEARLLASQRAASPSVEFQQACALLTACLAFRGGGTLGREALQKLAGLVPELILPDGGPADRNPASLVSFLAQLVPLRACLESHRVEVPAGLQAAIERALPMLRLLSHGDGGLCSFQGVSDPLTDQVRQILVYDASGGRPLAYAPHAGYCRMAHGQSVVIVDCGEAEQCDSALAFELSAGAERIVVSCGLPANRSASWQKAASAAAAHSTLGMDCAQSTRAPAIFARRSKRKAPKLVSAEVIASPHGTLIKAGNAAYSTSLGLMHRREYFLAANGYDLRGEDRIEPTGPDSKNTHFAIRFHLHPGVRASMDRKGTGVLLMLPNHEAWQFSARGGSLVLEDSVYLTGENGHRMSRQIVLRGTAGRLERVNWAFKKLDTPATERPPEEPAPRLPF